MCPSSTAVVLPVSPRRTVAGEVLEEPHLMLTKEICWLANTGLVQGDLSPSLELSPLPQETARHCCHFTVI